MNAPNESESTLVGKIVLAFGLLIVSMIAAHGAAEWYARCSACDSQTKTNITDANRSETTQDVIAAEGVLAYRSYFTLWALTLLSFSAFCSFPLRPINGSPSYGLPMWTASGIAYLVYVGWASLAKPNAGLTVLLVILGAWWIVDVLLAWISVIRGDESTPRLIELQRGAVHIVAFIAIEAMSVLSPAAGSLLRLLGILLAFAVAGSFTWRFLTFRQNETSFSSSLFRLLFKIVNGLGLHWYQLPKLAGVLNLGALRDELREKNLFGTNDILVSRPQGRDKKPAPPAAADLCYRNVDGYYNDLRTGKWEMGSASTNSTNNEDPSDFDRSNPGARFGRNMPLHVVNPDEATFGDPSPREISRHLLARKGDTQKAGFLNLLAAAWIQFEIHDWVFHGNPIVGNEIRIPLRDDDNWDKNRGEMLVRRTRPDPTRDYESEGQNARAGSNPKPPPPTYTNAGTHWWDASQIYGDDPGTTRRLRTPPGGKDVLPGGKLYLDDGLLPIDPTDPDFKIELTGFNGNWWLGLTLLHTLFVREHNAICEMLVNEYPKWDSEIVFQTARLVNAALMAKIHTIEWTTAILPNPTLDFGMNLNWAGFAGEPIDKVFGRIGDGDLMSGIMGSMFNHHTADYSLTEEFVSVYRMHPLLPDRLRVFSAASGGSIDEFSIGDVLGPDARKRGFSKATLIDLFYSFGIANPGRLILRNFPDFLRTFVRPDGDRVDLATVDILRDRERGIPRYNEFRRWLRLPHFRSIDDLIAASEQLSEDHDLAAEFKRIYRNDVELVDPMIGMFAETPPPQFGFSETAFRIFILMASRRLKSDRYFTTDFRPEIYSPAGFTWISDNNMRTILLRHYPELAPYLRGKTNAFAPWQTLEESRNFDPYENPSPIESK